METNYMSWRSSTEFHSIVCYHNDKHFYQETLPEAIYKNTSSLLIIANYGTHGELYQNRIGNIMFLRTHPRFVRVH